MADVMPAPHEPSSYQHDPQPSDEAQSKMETSSTSRSVTPTSVNAARRPPRKSTLTQQQKNQKRQRATQDQLMTLEVEFNKNPTPTALVRERIAQDINMTERSVQIWFQNRRAKIKNIAKRSIESGEDCDSIPDSMRHYLAMQAYGPGGKAFAAGMLGRAGPGYPSYAGVLSLNPDASASKTAIQHFACRSLSIGTWRRVGQNTMDLVIFYAPDKACVTYYINNENSGYKVEYPFAWIKNISLEQGDVIAAAEGASQRSGGLVIELNHAPKFYMDSSGQGGFYECGDFTEDQQASQVMVHHLGGPSKVLSGQLAKLVSLDAYQNRHNAFEQNPFAVSAPVSPMRPASQPNHMMHPHHPMPMFPSENMAGVMGPPAPRGHKRQRSRSVPAAMDFATMRHPMPSFLIQHDGPPSQVPVQDPTIFAPIPQHQHPHGFAPGPLGHNLSIDTSASYGIGLPFSGSMSATTANSPSEYGTPAFFTSAPPGDNMHALHFHTPFNHGFLAVDPAAMIGTSNTPLSVVSNGDPVIADHSPPMTALGRSQSVDFFGNPSEQSQFGDDGLYLSETFNKQMHLPFRGPLSEDSFHSPMPDGTFNFQSPPGTSESQIHLPMGSRVGSISFDCPPPQTQDGSMMYNSPSQPPHGSQQHQQQHHQDSGISFSTPDQATIFNSPKDSGIVYQDSKMYSSPGQMHQLSEEQSLYHHSPLPINSANGEMDMHSLGMYGTIDPHSLGQPPPQQ